ncbi:hypothetical protein SLS62_004056 [Diatrype stigma]|uniref:C2 domain-containing protein n=1 Tax=Diatrype stigma TaxID=117547 RepID=A0AAN9UVB7_9PEZI
MAAKAKPFNPLNGMHTAGIFSDMSIDGPAIGTLVVIVDRAKNLPNRKTIGKQDPYTAARLGKEARKTTTDIRGGQTPKWDQELRFNVHDSPDYYQLKLSVFNDDKRTDLIGETWIDLRDIIVQGGGQSDQWHTLTCKGKYAGEIRIETTYYDIRPKPERPAPKPRHVASSLELKTANVPQKTAVKRRPLPSDPVTGKSPSPAVPHDVQTPPRQKPSGPSPYLQKQSPMQSIEYSTPQPSQRFSRSQSDLHSYTELGGNPYLTPSPRQDYQSDRDDMYSPYDDQHQYYPDSRPQYERKSVSPAPPPESRSDTRRLSGVPFGPDSYDELNPVVAAAKDPDSNSNEYTNSDGKIVTADGREVDPSDHLPMESWAPEPEPKKPTATSTDSRSRPALSGAQPMPPSGRRPLRVTVRPQSTGGAPAPSYSTEVVPFAPASAGRNRLQKKQHRVSALPALMSSGPNPLGPATAHQRNSTPPRALVRASTFDYENYAPPSYGAPRSGLGDAPPIPAKVPMMMSGGMGPTPAHDSRGGDDWALMEEMSRIDIGTGRARRHIAYRS